MSLIDHAERELKLAGLFDKDSDYGGMIAEAVMKLIKTHSAEGHSGFSHAYTLHVFNIVANFKPLAPIGTTKDEWMEVGDEMWQNKRQSSCFSTDAGKPYFRRIVEGSHSCQLLRRRLGCRSKASP